MEETTGYFFSGEQEFMDMLEKEGIDKLYHNAIVEMFSGVDLHADEWQRQINYLRGCTYEEIPSVWCLPCDRIINTYEDIFPEIEERGISEYYRMQFDDKNKVVVWQDWDY